MDDFEFQVNIVERMARIEEKIDQLTGVISLIDNHRERITRAEENGKSALWRVTELESATVEMEKKIEGVKKEIYWTAGAIVAGVNFVFLLLERIGG